MWIDVLIPIITLIVGGLVGFFGKIGIEYYKHKWRLEEIKEKKKSKTHPMIKRYLENPEHYGIEDEEEN